MIRNVKVADLYHLEDFPEREVHMGVTEEDLVREEFDSEEGYQAYLAYDEAEDSMEEIPGEEEQAYSEHEDELSFYEEEDN